MEIEIILEKKQPQLKRNLSFCRNGQKGSSYSPNLLYQF